jgi:thiosulfate/3-mercaptopyruvate sulfurtransferase
MNKVVSSLFATTLVAASAFALHVPKDHIVSDKWLKDHMSDKHLVIIDTRSPKQYKAGHIPGAVNAPLGKDFRESRYWNPHTKKPIPGYIAAPVKFTRTMRNAGVNNDDAIVYIADFKSAHGFPGAALATYTTIYYGHNNAAILDGGTEAWKQHGGKVTTEATRARMGHFKIERFNLSNIATVPRVDEAVTLHTYQLLDARGAGKPMESHYYGIMKKKQDTRLQAYGHLPGAKPAFVGDFEYKKDGVWYIGSKEHDIKLLESRGFKVHGKPIMTYCNTGHFASGAWFALKFVVGLEHTRAYNGSMADYTALPDRPLVTGTYHRP